MLCNPTSAFLASPRSLTMTTSLRPQAAVQRHSHLRERRVLAAEKSRAHHRGQVEGAHEGLPEP
ncbi:uncharacterized protein B0I36DRAFT_332584 [Microdochium trichocladiopsis]|uniref:Uncharacterized protein n=1 Tax=Microdochium trichocladiopsis TaxID=1682393 RepID=A0A9P8XYJ4_9PEZI|nr:uncharacterized protein B0I36DRAFT_332584 [Microdochium trichocladiopsis]KAH7025142.1 hypothetical protein B0I36DRAFT_332584 [Microdochium trichocladiopsis]